MELELPNIKRKTWIEGFAAPGALRPLMQAVIQDPPFAAEGGWYQTEAFPLFMGVCGDAFRFVWYRQDGGPLQPDDRRALAPSAAYVRGLEAAGFAAKVVEAPLDEADARREVVASLAVRKWPVLLVDVPEAGWNAVIVGYDNDGRTLSGWCEESWESFGFRFDPKKKRTFDGWAKASRMVLLTARHARPPEEQVLRGALQRALPQLRERTLGALLAGPATYEALARRLEDNMLSGADEATARRRDSLLHPMIWDLATQRHYAAAFVTRAADVFAAAAADLRAAAGDLNAIHDAVWQINRIGGGRQPGSPLPKLVDAAARKQVAEILLRCRDRDLAAADRIEAATKKFPPVPATGPSPAGR